MRVVYGKVAIMQKCIMYLKFLSERLNSVEGFGWITQSCDEHPLA